MMFIKQFDKVRKKLPESVNLTICHDTGEGVHSLTNLQTAVLKITA